MAVGRPKKVRTSLEADLLLHGTKRLERLESTTFPNERYLADPVAFCREILGFEPFPWQVEILEAVRDNKRVAVRSGHKIGKSRIAVVLALWWYCTHEDARVVKTSTTDRQVNAILWRELRKVHGASGVCVECKRAKYKGPKPCPHSAIIDGAMGELARTGLKANDFREITGYTAKEPEAIAGVSGGALLYLADEASGIPDVIFEAIEGNRAGGASLAMFSNPTKNSGKFYEAFSTKAHLWKHITVSSWEVAKYFADNHMNVPGMASLGWVEEMRQDWGEDSAKFSIRVLGKHAEKEEGKIFPLHAIEAAEEAWDEHAPQTEAAEYDVQGVLQLGIDPAGPTGSGDDSAFCLRRGHRELWNGTMSALSHEGHLIEVLRLLTQHKREGETPVVCMDREGDVGSKVYRVLAAHADPDTPGAKDFRLVGVRASDRAVREPMVYDRMRDGLTASLEGWLRAGGQILRNVHRAKEMHQMEWFVHALNGRYKVTPKDKVRKELGRSPDRYDALALAVWEPLWLRDQGAAGAAPAAAAPVQAEPAYAQEGSTFDPYRAARAFRS